MRLTDSPATNSYTFILTEGEWYLATEQEKLAWVNQIKREGMEAGRANLNILVRPDGVMSVSPNPNMHCVWSHIVKERSTDEELFLAALQSAYENSRIPYARKLAIAKEFFKS